MALKDLLEKSEKRMPKRRSGSSADRLAIIDMSAKSYENWNGDWIPCNRGTITICPITALNGDYVKYLYDVKEYTRSVETDYGPRNVTTMVAEIDDYLTNLNEDQKAIVTALRSQIDTLTEYLGEKDFWKAKSKNYAMIFGYVLNHYSNEEESNIITKDSRKPALIVVPSKNFAKAIKTCLVNIEKESDSEEIFDGLFSRNPERDSYLEIDCDLSDGFGYDVNISYGFLSDRAARKFLRDDEVQTMKVTIPEEALTKCTSHSAIFLAGNYEDEEDFNEEYVKAAQKDITDELNIRDAQYAEAKGLEEAPEAPEAPDENEKKDNWENEGNGEGDGEPEPEPEKPKRGRKKSE